jgi:hypothetical protein
MINVNNRMQIIDGQSGSGGYVLVPGLEPVSITLPFAQLYRTNPYIKTILNCGDYNCHTAYITVLKALEVIPGSFIVRTNNNMKFYCLPAGPPPAGSKCNNIEGGDCLRDVMQDYYNILRANADIGKKETPKTPTLDQICSAFSPNFCK